MVPVPPRTRALHLALAVCLITVFLIAPASWAGLDGGSSFEFTAATSSQNKIGTALNPPNNFTMEAWVYPTNVSGVHPIKGQEISVDDLIFQINNGFLELIRNGNSNSGSVALQTGVWQHVAVTYDGTFVRFYVNAIGSGIQIDVSGPVAPATFILGANYGVGGGVFEGEMDEFRLWYTNRSETEIRRDMFAPLTGNEADLYVYFPLDEGSGFFANDVAPLGGPTSIDFLGTFFWRNSTAPLTDLSQYSDERIAMWQGRPDTSADLRDPGLTVADFSFLQDKGDDVVFAHNGLSLSLVTDQIPGAVGNRYDRLWQFAAADEGAAGGSVLLNFDDGGFDTDRLYHLLRRAAGTTDPFEVTDVTTSDGSTVVFQPSASSLSQAFEYTLGSMADADIGLYFDALHTQTVLDDLAVGTSFNAYLVIKGLTEGASAWEAFLQVPPEVNLDGAILSTPGTNSGTPGGQDWNVDLGACLPPDANGDLRVVGFQFTLLTRPVGGTLTFALDGRPGGTFANGEPGWFDCGTPANGAWFTSKQEPSMVFSSPAISSVDDLPDDQGGSVVVNIDRSWLDQLGSAAPVSGYNVWREVVGSKARLLGAGVDLASAVDLETELSEATRAQLESWGAVVWNGSVYLTTAQAKAPNTFPPGTWQIVGSFYAAQQNTYAAPTPTVDDDPITSTFFVSAHTVDPFVWYGSDAVSGSSVDNIAPGVPSSIIAAYQASGVDLAWDAAPEPDFQYWRVYRDTNPGFVPGPGNLVQQIATSAWTDATASPFGFFYKITALDHAGNESAAGSPGSVTANENVPSKYALSNAVPNPFNPRTTLQLRMATAGEVRLVVYDIAGRHVATLLNGMKDAGTHEAIWTGTDDGGNAVASGVYIVRMQTPGFVETRRVTLVR